MNEEILFKIDKLQKNLERLINENFEYRQKIVNFEQILQSNNEKLSRMQHEFDSLKLENEQLKLGKALVGNEYDNEEAKKKIDSLIKEINSCILTLKQ